MRVVQGVHRTVIELPRLRLRLKLPRIRPHAIPRTMAHLRHAGIRNALGSLRRRHGFLHELFLEGWAQNRSERRYCRQQHAFMLEPVRLVLFGLVSFQRLRPTINMTEEVFHQQLSELTDGAILTDPIHFRATNFTFEKSHLRIIDYGDRITQSILSAYTNRIHHDFTQNYPRWRPPVWERILSTIEAAP